MLKLNFVFQKDTCIVIEVGITAHFNVKDMDCIETSANIVLQC